MTSETVNPFVGLKAETTLPLEADDRYPAAGHWWSQPEIDALILARAARRPLLVRGEAGSGKSQIARAAAQVLGTHRLLVEVIHPRFEALDLLYRIDSVSRLADAQLGADHLDPTQERYVDKGCLWQAFEPPAGESAPAVLLIDEVDKGEADVPNALLEVLGNRSFTVPPLNDRVIRPVDGRVPLVIFTTNEERELPPAFVRRCVVLNLNPPSDPAEFVDWLVQRGSTHRHLAIEDEARKAAAHQVHTDREATLAAGYPPVGLAEYIDLLTALDDLTRAVPEAERTEAQAYWLNRLSAYALIKNADQRQDRGKPDGDDGAGDAAVPPGPA